MTSTEADESHQPSRGLLAGGHPLPPLRPHKNRNCISRSAVRDEHPRPVSPKLGETRTGIPIEFVLLHPGLFPANLSPLWSCSQRPVKSSRIQQDSQTNRLLREWDIQPIALRLGRHSLN